MLERSDIDFPLWRKKVDASLLNRGETPIPKWLHQIWDIDATFSGVTTKSSTKSKVHVFFGGTVFNANVTHRVKEGKYWLRLDRSLVSELQSVFLSSYMRTLEAELIREDDEKTSSHRDIEARIPFWEFLDIEFDQEKSRFIFTAHYTQLPQFPKLFAELVDSAPLKRLESKISGNNVRRFPFQSWKCRDAYRREVGARNVIYFLLDSERKLLYIGEAQDLIRRFNQGHSEIAFWDRYAFFCLPDDLANYRLAIERILIQFLSTVLVNQKNTPEITSTEYRLANLKIDK